LLNLLQSQLSFYGAIDEAVLYAKQGDRPNRDAVLRTVETLLPGTTGFAQAGWYRELQQVASRPGVRVGDSPINGVNFADELVRKMGKLARPDVDEDVARLVHFEPDAGVLKAGRSNNEFKLTINCAEFPAGSSPARWRFSKPGILSRSELKRSLSTCEPTRPTARR
jgi:hypothetical protein